jgi:toxin ParE1/3/4
MDFIVSWSPEAVEDLESIAEYISRDSDFYAKAVVSKILSVAEKLSNQPNIGRIVPEINDLKIRECFVYSYRLVYLIDDKRIIILAVIHGNRLISNISDRIT